MEIDEIIDREMSDKEFEIYLAQQEEITNKSNEQKRKEMARDSALAKLAALGLTPEEIAAL
jgi:tryptophanyl-tRNA synthetase